MRWDRCGTGPESGFLVSRSVPFLRGLSSESVRRAPDRRRILQDLRAQLSMAEGCSLFAVWFEKFGEIT